MWLIVSARTRGWLLTSPPATPLLFGAITFQALACGLLVVKAQLHLRDVALILAWNAAWDLLLVDPLKVALLKMTGLRSEHSSGSEWTTAREKALL